jgi:hypothetical protein
MAEMDWQRGGLTPTCDKCHRSIRGGFAKCHECGAVREEFREYANLIHDETAACIWSGAETDVVLPNGHAVWAPYLLDMIEAGWLDGSFGYTETAYQKHPHLRSLPS